jgi:hypothetical protein
MERPPILAPANGVSVTDLHVHRVVVYSRLAERFLADAYELLVPEVVRNDSMPRIPRVEIHRARVGLCPIHPTETYEDHDVPMESQEA